MQEIEAIISGRVQLVMFRDFTQRHAKNLGLIGTVQNLKDKTVKVVAQGQRTKLLALIQLLGKGPVLAHVDDVSVTWREPQGTFEGFTIIYT